MYNFQMEGLQDVYKEDTRGKKIIIPIVSKSSTPTIEEAPTEAINVNRPIRWEKFKTLPAALQKPYIEHLRKTYAVTNIQIGQMMGIDNSYVGKLVKRLGIKVKSEKQTTEQLEAWTCYITSRTNTHDIQASKAITVRDNDTKSIAIYKSDTESSINIKPESSESDFEGTELLCTKQILEFTGLMSARKVMSMIEKAFPDGSKCNIRIEIESSANGN